MWIIGTGLGMIMRVRESAAVLEVKGVGPVGLLVRLPARRAEVVVVGVGTPVARAKAIVIRAEVLVTGAEAAPVGPAHASVDTKSKTSFSFVDMS